MQLFKGTMFIALALSLLTKYCVDTFLHVRFAILGSFLGFDPVHNPGVAFGIRLPSSVQSVVILFALLLVCGAAWQSRHRRIDQLGYGLIVGGALANLVDRMRDGLVTDFIQVGTFPVFNVADSCITIGVCVLLFDVLTSQVRRTGV